MADYKELLRRAVEALPENNGAARRAVYEKARAALVGQLRAINPPLAARDITAHRLQLEDCIRQVEQEASEAVIAGLGAGRDDNPPPPPVYFEAPAKKAAPTPAKPVAKPLPSTGKEPPKPLPPGGTIEEIIAAANAETESSGDRSRAIVRPDAKPMGKPVPKLVPSSSRPQVTAARHDESEDEVDETPPAPPARTPASKPVAGRPLPSIVARAEAAKSRTGGAQFGAPISGVSRGPVLEPRRELAAPRFEPAARGSQATARQVDDEPAALFNSPPVAAAMSAVREVEVEAPADPQHAIDRAIATLDREARGDDDEDEHINGGYADNDDIEDDEPPYRNGFAPSILAADAPSIRTREREGKAAKASGFARDAREPRAKREPEPRFARSRDESDRRGLGAVTIFLIVFAVLLVGAGGAGFWAWREGFIDLDTMFGQGAATEQAAVTQPATPASTDAPAIGPGNTSTPAEIAPPTAELAVNEDRLGSETAPAALPLVEPGTEARLGADATPAADAAAEQAVASVDPASLAGSQSLLLEASDSGTTGAVPFSGTVEWSKGTDEMGLPTLIGKATIPARNLTVDVLIRKNSDGSLPASHLMEVNFRVTDSFIGGSIAGLPGVLLKNEELVQGTPLVGASARVVGNSFLFALSAAPADVTTNSTLLTSRKWMDLALIYATGKRAIITLEKDAAAETMFNEVVAAWTAAPAPSNG